MITVFCDIRQPSAKNWRSKANVSVKRHFFRQIFWRKYFYNHNIGPRVCFTNGMESLKFRFFRPPTYVYFLKYFLYYFLYF
jgi:hypothetical protein